MAITLCVITMGCSGDPAGAPPAGNLPSPPLDLAGVYAVDAHTSATGNCATVGPAQPPIRFFELRRTSAPDGDWWSFDPCSTQTSCDATSWDVWSVRDEDHRGELQASAAGEAACELEWTRAALVIEDPRPLYRAIRLDQVTQVLEVPGDFMHQPDRCHGLLASEAGRARCQTFESLHAHRIAD
jgi:hypothetical protein